MKILIDARMAHGLHGIGRYARNLILGLRERGHTLTLLVSKENPFSAQDGVRLIKCKIPFAHPLEIFELAQKTRSVEYDVAHFPSFALPALPTPRTVVTIHDLIHLHDGSFSHHLYYNNFLKPRLKTVSAVIAVSEWGKTELCSKLNVNEKKITVVRNGLEPQWFNKKDQALSKIPTLVCLTNLKKHKNAKTLIEACVKLWSEDFHFRLILSLGGDEIPQSWNLSSENLQNITLLKKVSDAEVLNHLAACWALVSPSVMEGFDYPAAEALAQNKPIILSKGSAHDEFDSSNTFFYGEPLDTQGLIGTIKTVLEKTPQNTIQHNVLTRDDMVKTTIEVYQRILSH